MEAYNPPSLCKNYLNYLDNLAFFYSQCLSKSVACSVANCDRCETAVDKCDMCSRNFKQNSTHTSCTACTGSGINCEGASVTSQNPNCHDSCRTCSDNSKSPNKCSSC